MAVTEIDEVLVPNRQSGPTMAFEIAEKGLFGFQVFDDGFDHQAGVGEVGQIVGRLSRVRRPRRRRSSCPCRRVWRTARLPGGGAGGGVGAVVEQLDRMAGRRRHLGDAGAHGAAADDGDDGAGEGVARS